MSLISVHHLTFGYEGSYDTILEDVSFSLDTNWKTGLIGRNGRGKTTFLKLLMGEYSYEGSITASTAFDYFPFLPSDLSATTLDVANAVCPDCEYWQLVRELSLLRVEEEVLYRSFETLSHGERTKVLLAALFAVVIAVMVFHDWTRIAGVIRRLFSSWWSGLLTAVYAGAAVWFIFGWKSHSGS